MNYYIASCVFTAQFPELSKIIRDYVASRFGFEIIRCCVPNWKVKEYIEKAPEGALRKSWQQMPETAAFQPGDEVWSLCHNCSNILEECHPGVAVHSLWELIDQDADFPFPDYSGLKVTVQDCWRSKERREEQDAVRSLLKKMNIEYVEAAAHHEKTDFCGNSLYRAQVARNPKLAPKHYLEGAAGKFIPHSVEEQVRIMKDHCAQYETDTVVCYCHYCLEGLKTGEVDGRHIAHLLFPEK